MHGTLSVKEPTFKASAMEGFSGRVNTLSTYNNPCYRRRYRQ